MWVLYIIKYRRKLTEEKNFVKWQIFKTQHNIFCLHCQISLKFSGIVYYIYRFHLLQNKDSLSVRSNFMRNLSETVAFFLSFSWNNWNTETICYQELVLLRMGFHWRSKLLLTFHSTALVIFTQVVTSIYNHSLSSTSFPGKWEKLII